MDQGLGPSRTAQGTKNDGLACAPVSMLSALFHHELDTVMQNVFFDMKQMPTIDRQSTTGTSFKFEGRSEIRYNRAPRVHFSSRSGCTIRPKRYCKRPFDALERLAQQAGTRPATTKCKAPEGSRAWISEWRLSLSSEGMSKAAIATVKTCNVRRGYI